ncbi:MAG: hypothetical protein [Siphoviridae sp. ctdEk19]|nr:MAG: hypothetical protein [Siphoviridae sp. ctdEk19]
MDSFDDLLSEALAEQAKRKLATKRRPLDPQLAAEWDEAVEIATWQPEAAVALFVQTECSCGAVHLDFASWYILSRHSREATALRWKKVDDHGGLPAAKHVVTAQTTWCSLCINPLPPAEEYDIPGLDAFGEPCDCGECEQLDLFELPCEITHQLEEQPQ